jgi:GntR family transcriptional regulator/MocR family aminotransferase
MEDSANLEPLFPDRDSSETLGHQLTRRLRDAIESGLYKPSSRLLPSRELAARLGLARNTVTTAIEQLIAEGYLEARVGSGTFVAPTIVKNTIAARPGLLRLPETAERFRSTRAVLDSYATGAGPLRPGRPDLTAFPHAIWARIARRKLGELSTYLDYGESKGNPALREAIAQHVQQFRGVTAAQHRVIVVEGTQAAIRLCADVLLREGDAALIEDPGYPFARIALQSRDVRVLPVRVDHNGIDVAQAPSARLAYVSPSNQFPLGARMSLERRHRLLAWANENDAYVIEDDYDSEYVFDAKPLPTLQSIDRGERVLYVGSFSKTLAPGLRLGYLIVPQHLATTFSLARLASTLGSTQFVQAMLAEFLAEGHFARHVRRMTRIYGERRRAVVAVLEEGLPADSFSIGAANAGLHVALIGPPDFDDVAVSNELAAEGLAVQPLSAFCIGRSDCRGFIVGYSAAALPEVLRATRLLVRHIESRVESNEPEPKP